MRRTLVILCFIAGLSLLPLPVRGQGIEGAQSQFVEAFLAVRRGEDQEKAGNLKAALATFRSAADTLTRIKQENPNWQVDLLDFRLKRTMEALDRIQEKIGGAPAGRGGDAGVLPPLPLENDPLTGDAGAPPPKSRTKKGPPLIDSGDPLGPIKQRLSDLENKLSEANDRLREEQERNAQLSKDIGEAMTARKRAEEAKKKAQDLAEVYQKSMLDLKAAGDSNGARAKELEAKLAAANQTSLDTQADLAAAEERISQLLGRSRTLAEQASKAGTMPAQIKALQAKLDSEQKATAQQTENAKKREEDLKNQIAALSKNKGDSAGAMAELKALEARLAAEQKASASEALMAKKREEDLKSQLASITQERNDAREELVRLRELNKQTDKLMADNASLLKKLGDAEKQILAYKSTGSRDSDLAALRKQVMDTQKALSSSDEKNAVLQGEISELQKKVTDYSKQIAQFKADTKASAEERKKMEDENRLLQGIVMRVLQEDANRAQRKKMIQGEIGKLHLQSDALLRQINYLTEPVVKLSAAERKLFKKPVFDVQDPNRLVAVKTEGPPASEPPKTGVEKPEPGTPEKEPPKTGVAPSGGKPNTNDDLPVKDATGPSSPESSATPPVTSIAGAKLPPEVKPLAEQAKQAFEREKFSDSEKLYDKALQTAPNNVYLLSNRAVVQFRMGKFKQAEESFKKALAIAPEDAFCWSTIGIVYYSEGKFDDAVNALTKSLAINPKNPTAHNYLGITAAQKGWLEAAQKELESSIQLDPKYADAWYNLAVTHTLKTPPDKVEAQKAYAKAIELGAEKDPAMDDLLNK